MQSLPSPTSGQPAKLVADPTAQPTRRPPPGFLRVPLVAAVLFHLGWLTSAELEALAGPDGDAYFADTITSPQAARRAYRSVLPLAQPTLLVAWARTADGARFCRSRGGMPGWTAADGSQRFAMLFPATPVANAQPRAPGGGREA